MVLPQSRPEALRVDLAALRRRGIDIHEMAVTLPVPWLAEVLGDTDAEVSNAASITLRVLLQPAGVVVVQGQMSLAFVVPCGRCLEDAAVDGSGEIFATFMPGGAADGARSDADEDEATEADDAAQDVWRYEGPALWLDPLVADQVALAYPMRALCERGPDCRGLCSNCGFELNSLAAEALQCPQCHNEVPLTPVAERSSPTAPEQRDEREVNPLAAALSKLDLGGKPDDGDAQDT